MPIWNGGHGCELAVRIDGKPYFVDGTSIPMAMLMPMMAFVLLSERHPLLAK
jgi:hypothetical protein